MRLPTKRQQCLAESKPFVLTHTGVLWLAYTHNHPITSAPLCQAHVVGHIMVNIPFKYQVKMSLPWKTVFKKFPGYPTMNKRYIELLMIIWQMFGVCNTGMTWLVKLRGSCIHTVHKLLRSRITSALYGTCLTNLLKRNYSRCLQNICAKWSKPFADYYNQQIRCEVRSSREWYHWNCEIQYSFRAGGFDSWQMDLGRSYECTVHCLESQPTSQKASTAWRNVSRNGKRYLSM